MRILIRAAIFLSLLFLFGGLFLVGILHKDNTVVNDDLAYYNSMQARRFTIKQIDSISASTNYNFTAANGPVTSTVAPNSSM